MTKHYLSECLIIKNENQYLLEHIRDNVLAGVDYFYIYDNQSDISVEEFLKKEAPELLDKCTIQVYKETGLNRQEICYDNFLKEHRNDTVWVTFTDTDEIYEGELKKLLQENEDKAGFYFCGITHCSNGHVFKNNKTMKENFYPDVTYDWWYQKCCFQTKYIKSCDILSATLLDDAEKNKIVTIKNNLSEKVKLHHYYYKSFEEWCQKIIRGSMHDSILYRIWMFFKVKNNKIDPEDMKKVLDKYNITLLNY